jgi:GMP synthase (glutamine-hydrolysing)
MEHSLERGVLVLDYGSQYTLLIARRIREQGVYCEIWPCNDPRVSDFIEAEEPPAKALILSGGPNSLHVDGAPRLAGHLSGLGIPVLGICYGMQLIADIYGGTISEGHLGEYGRTRVELSRTSPLFNGFVVGTETTVWMSHGDVVEDSGDELETLAVSENNVVAALMHRELPIYGVQFHPEVMHTERGTEILRNFLFRIAKCDDDWNMGDFLSDTVEQIREQVGDGRVICGLSGGVDSSVVAALLAKAIPNQVTCIFVDTGLLRKNEGEKVEEAFRGHFDVDFRAIDARERFLSKLEGVSSPEKKRKLIGNEFIRVFEEAAESVEGARFLAQGTLYPDVIESVSVRGPSATIKSHHNVGGLPEDMQFELIEPLRELFKDEVRELGRQLGLPDELVGRHPFPGPGLAVRILGELDKERISTLQEADAIYIDALKEDELYDEVWQAFAVLIPVKTVGVMGDSRTYEWLCALRAVTSTDGMTADRAQLPHEFLGKVSDRIINQVPRINRVVYDISSKPPATIEWE